MKIAASTYLNSAPLVYSFAAGAQRNQVNLTGDAAPSHCARLLAEGQCDVALIPVIEYQRIPGLRIVADVSVAAKSSVRSVLLISRRPLDEIRGVALDNRSRTSQVLVRLLLAQPGRKQPQYVTYTPDGTETVEGILRGQDAALVIGDPALSLRGRVAGQGIFVYDLAEEWRKMTGLPFVFAVWAAREDVCQNDRILGVDFVTAKHEGLQQIPEIAGSYAAQLNLPREELLVYLRECVNFDLDENNLAGMKTYFAMADAYGLIEGQRDLRFVSSALA
ncbi:MAG: menaquinone biosynthetic enzyme MqnA/MqnD family protein [Blastocatellia bacterium]